ncbi:MAG: hypothetical protein HOV81_21615 [Kofleriaceae bacterium]|nr:hypothetical protein [Kofleriaceae bacterium]
MNAEAVVRRTVATFIANPDAVEVELEDILERIGLPEPEHAVILVPLAYRHHRLDGIIPVPSTYVDFDEERAVPRICLALPPRGSVMLSPADRPA